MPKNPMHSCGGYLKNLYYRDQENGDRKVKVKLLYCPNCNVYFNTDYHEAEIQNLQV